MNSVQIVSSVIGLSLGGAILWLVRRDRLHGMYALWWLVLALGIVGLGLFPSLVDRIGAWLGITYPPILVLILGLGLALLKLLTLDIHRSHLQQDTRRLTQRIALLERELARLRRSQGRASDRAPAGGD